MLLPYLKVLHGKKIILGSQSKSRNELMTAQRIPYTVIPSKFEEDLEKGLYKDRPEDYNMVRMHQCRTPVEARWKNYSADLQRTDWIGTCSSVEIPSSNTTTTSSKNLYLLFHPGRRKTLYRNDGWALQFHPSRPYCSYCNLQS